MFKFYSKAHRIFASVNFLICCSLQHSIGFLVVLLFFYYYFHYFFYFRTSAANESNKSSCKKYVRIFLRDKDSCCFRFESIDAGELWNYYCHAFHWKIEFYVCFQNRNFHLQHKYFSYLLDMALYLFFVEM